MKLKLAIDFEAFEREAIGYIKLDFERETLYKKDFEPYYYKVIVESLDGQEILDEYIPAPLLKWKGNFIPGQIIRGTLDGENVVMLLKVNSTYYRIFEDE